MHVCVCVCRCTRYALCSAYAWCVRVMCAHGCTHVCACVVRACREPLVSAQGSLFLDPGASTGEAATMSGYGLPNKVPPSQRAVGGRPTLTAFWEFPGKRLRGGESGACL